MITNINLKHLDDGNYKFEKRSYSINTNYKLKKILKYNNGWNSIREKYIKLKNNNKDINKRSSILYLESIHNIYNQIKQDNSNNNIKVIDLTKYATGYIDPNYLRK